jgi:hypothetical protein
MSLAPSIFVELAHFSGSDQFLVEICSVAKSNLSDVANKIKRLSQTQDDESTSHQTHCSLCVTHSDELSLLPTQPFVFPILKNSFAFPSLFYQTAHLVFIWAAPQSRAPPFLS